MVIADLKCANVFLGDPQDPYTNYPTPKLADFDLAIEQKHANREVRHRGTLGWQAPENIYGDPKPPLSPKSDM